MNLDTILKIVQLAVQLTPVVIQVIQQVEQVVNESKAGEQKKAIAVNSIVAAVKTADPVNEPEHLVPVVSHLIDLHVAELNKNGTFAK